MPTARPIPGHEVFGFVPYWEMNGDIAAHVAATDLTTLALFSVTHTKSGAIDTKQTGYKRITGDIGTQLIREAHARGIHVQFVYSSFGTARNQTLFTSPKIQDATIAGLVALAKQVGVDGIDVDVEQLGPELVPAYGAFVGRLREALRAAIPDASVSVATTSGLNGAAMAMAAVGGGADRVFLMGYDYHYAGSEVGASAPMARRDGAVQDLPWSLDLYAAAGVPVDKTILGLPLYGTRWRVAGPEIGAPRLGNGAIWVPADNPKFLADPPAPPEFDPIEVDEFYCGRPDGQPGPRRFARDRGLAGDLRRLARDADAKAGARRRPRPGRRRVLGDRVRARPGGLRRPHRSLRGRQARLGQIQETPARRGHTARRPRRAAHALSRASQERRRRSRHRRALRSHSSRPGCTGPPPGCRRPPRSCRSRPA